MAENLWKEEMSERTQEKDNKRMATKVSVVSQVKEDKDIKKNVR